MAHEHSHGHDDTQDHDDHHDHNGHSHHHGEREDYGRAFLIAILLNASFVAAEFGYGIVANSTALIADAGHNLSDVLGLLLAWGAAILARRTPSGRYTFGMRSSSILAALSNAIFLLIACGAIAWEAAWRFSQPPAVAGLTVTLVAAFGVVVNGISAYLFMRGSKGDLNIRGAYLHMAADAAISLGVAITGIAILITSWFWLDPVVSLVIVAIIVFGTWNLLRESLRLALQAVPPHINVTAVEEYLRHCTGVTGIHDLHIWGMSTTESALTVHLVIPSGYPGDAFMDEISKTLHTRFKIHHTTLQIELGTTDHACRLHR